VPTVGFGGGTPGEVPAADIAAIMERIAHRAVLAPDAEVSLEVNPGTSNGPHLRALRAAGVTRLSVGAQRFEAAELQFLDRIHSPEAIRSTVRAARAARFESVGLDLIYGLPGDDPPTWRATLAEALALAPDHVSAYALTVEEGTSLARRVARGEVTLPDADAVADLYEAAGDALDAAGFRQYELSNWARPGHESRHNRVYWRDGDYLGLGAGAHGYVDGERYENVSHPRAYVGALSGAAGALPVASRYEPGAVTAMADWVMLRLRLIEGIRETDFAERFGIAMTAVLDAPIMESVAAGVLERSDGVIRLTRRGRLLHGEVAARCLAHLQWGVP
jgi:oxygen-independent coproporphyrinogen-3 oxidase